MPGESHGPKDMVAPWNTYDKINPIPAMGKPAGCGQYAIIFSGGCKWDHMAM